MNVDIVKCRNKMCTIEDYEKIKNSFLYKEIESFSNKFINSNREILEEYEWSPDPFHAWSRGFEYTYAYYEILECNREKLKISDLGSGVTFFPFFLKYKGFDVDTYDINAKYLKLYDYLSEKSNLKVKFYPRSIDYINKCNRYDFIYSISAIEHIDSKLFGNVIKTVYNMLKDNSIFVFTLDVSKNSNDNNSVSKIKYFIELLNHHFSSKLVVNHVTFDNKKNLTPKYVDIRYGSSDNFKISTKSILLSTLNALYKSKPFYKYPRINIYYGMCKK